MKWGARGAKNKNRDATTGTAGYEEATTATVSVMALPSAEERARWYAIEPVKMPKLIKFFCQYALLYETAIIAMMILNLALFPYDCFFNVNDPQTAELVYSLDIIFGIDVIIRLIVEEWRHRNRASCLVFMFPYRPHYVVLDILSIAPLYRIPMMLKPTSEWTFDDLGAMEWYQVPTLCRAYRVILFFSEMESTGLLYETIIFVVKFTIGYLAFILVVSVSYFWFTHLEELEYFLLTRNRDRLKETWAADFLNNEMTDTPIGFFLLTLNFATVVVTTVGYGDIAPRTEGEMFGSIFFMLIGAIFLSGYFQSQITSFCLQLDGARLDLFHRLDGIKMSLKNANMGNFFISKVEQYYKCLWTYREGVDRVLFMQLLPHSFQEDISYDICLEMFSKSYLFRGLDEAFLRSVSKIITIALYNPGMIVCRYGGYANKMYYIIQGECQAMSKHDTAKKAAILRAGSIIGETNLFFSCPYTISVETRNCCQIMCVDKEELMRLFNKFQNELNILRSRCQAKINDMYYYYERRGEDPVCWVEIRPDAHSEFINKSKQIGEHKPGRKSVFVDRNPEWPLCSMRWGYGFNDLITEDVILDAEEFVIFDYPCEDKVAKKDHVTPYTTCVVPEILASDITFIHVWNIAILICSLMYGFYAPYCLAFNTSSLIEFYVCKAGSVIEYINDVIYIIDVFVEVLGGAPVEGLYYKFRDGLNTKKNSVVFYLDVVSAIPLSFFQQSNQLVKQINVVIKSTKIWKAIRYLNYMDNVHPKHVFWFRLMQTCLVIVYGTHFIACTVFIQACTLVADPSVPGGTASAAAERDCTTDQNWLWSYVLRADGNIVDNGITVKALSTKNPYLVSFYYASATLTSAGFGDFSPQNPSEMTWAIVFTLVGFFLICYYTSVLTSALSCIVKPRLEFQQKLVAVRRFMEYYRLPDSLQRRVVQYYELQHQVRYGINLPHGIEHFLFDAPDYLKNDYLYTDNVVLFDGISLFSKVEAKYIIKMADVMRRFLIPPNVMFLHRGEVRRAMYLIQSGSCGVYDENYNEPKHILEATSHFGIRDLLFGEPSHFTIRTLSYCYMYEITYDHVIEVFEEDTELLDLIEDEKDMRHDEIEAMYNQYSQLEREQHVDAHIEIPSWVHFRSTKDNRGRNGRKYVEYDRFFDEFKGGRVMKWFLQNGSVHPVGQFAKWWSCWMSLVSCMTIMLLFMETFMYLRTPTLRLCQWILDTFFYVDIYIKLHWGYYQPKTGLLISHPLKTAGVYIFEGTYFTDVIFCTPLEMSMCLLGTTNLLGYGRGATWYTKMRWIRFLQVKRIPQIFSIVHDIFERRTLILFLLFVSLTLVVCSIVGSVALYIACPWEANNWADGDEYRLPACLADHWANTKFQHDYDEMEKVLAGVFDRWIFGLYYVSQVLLVIGFGDMITLNPSELLLLILMSVFGFVFMRCVIADMTAAEVDSDEIRARYTDAMKTLIRVMEKEKISRKLTMTVHDHLNNMWKRSKGLQPGRLFNDLHPSLESDVFRSYVGETLRKVAVFRDFTPNVLRTLCLYLKKLHFLKGDRLMRYGNLEYEMYIIVSGKVWITDKRLSYGCTLGRYETLGESSMLSFAARRYTAIAASSVETFVIARKDFDALIERYPKVKNILGALLRNGDYDFFEYKIYEMIDRLKELTGDERDRQIDILTARTNEIKSVVSAKETLSAEEAGDWITASAKNMCVHFISRFISSGSDDDGLPFFYLVGRRNRANGKYSIFPPLIHPNCGFIKLYFTFIFLLCLICPALAMFEFCMSDNLLKKLQSIQNYVPINEDEEILYSIHIFANDCEYFLISFIIVNLITPFQNEQGLYVKDFVQIVLNYMFAWDGMWMDLLASSSIVFDSSPVILCCTRTIRLYRYYSFYLKKKDDLSVSPFRLKIQLSVSSFILMAHYIACIFYRISSCHDDARHADFPCVQIINGNRVKRTHTWTFAYVQDRDINDNSDPRMHRWKWWLRSLYWVVTVVSTTGFGDIVPQNTEEMIVGIFCFFAGAFILSIILSSFTAGMTSITKAHREYLYQVKLLLKYLNNVGLSSIRLSQANIYFNVLWQKCRGRMYHEVTAILPTTLRIEVCNALYADVLSKVFILNIDNPTFHRQVASRVVHSIYLPGVCIVKEGDLGNSMYIVFRGQVSGIFANDSPAMELTKVYLVGDVFGKLPCLFHNEYYRKSYRAEVVTEVLELHSRDVIHLAALYPDFWNLLKALVAENYDPNGESDCVFSPQRARKKNIYDLGEDYQQAATKDETARKRRVPTRQTTQLDQPIELGKDKGKIGAHTASKGPMTSGKHHSKETILPKSHLNTAASNKDIKSAPGQKRKTEKVKEPIQFLYNRSRLTKLKEKTVRAGLSRRSRSRSFTPQKDKDTSSPSEKRKSGVVQKRKSEHASVSGTAKSNANPGKSGDSVVADSTLKRMFSKVFSSSPMPEKGTKASGTSEKKSSGGSKGSKHDKEHDKSATAIKENKKEIQNEVPPKGEKKDDPVKAKKNAAAKPKTGVAMNTKTDGIAKGKKNNAVKGEKVDVLKGSKTYQQKKN